MSAGATDGERLFARYAHAPNALGYCGPAAASVLREAACDLAVASADVRRVARQFSGAWPYQQLIGELAGLDPLSTEVGRAYWTGNTLTDAIDTGRLGELLLERFGSQAGHYWSHLTPDLLPEVTPTHVFHVLGVYPWTRLLGDDPTSSQTALGVLDSCRIRAGEVVGTGETLTVETESLTWDGHVLALGPTHVEEVGHTVAVGRRASPSTELASVLGAGEEDPLPAGQLGSFLGTPQEGDLVAVHWGFACDRLTTLEAEALRVSTARQLDLTNARLGRGRGGFTTVSG